MKKKPVKSILEYTLLSVALKVMKQLPRKLSEKIIVQLFVTAGMIFGMRKKTSFEQLKHAFPGKNNQELRTIQRKMYRHFGFTAADMFLTKDDSNKKIDIEGWENITSSLSLGRGLLLVGGHIGNWELAGRYIAHQNIPISVVIKKLRNPYVNNLINSLRTKHGINIIYKKRALKPTLKAFKNNETVVTLIDQDAGKEGVRIPFLDKDASLFTGFVRLAQKTDTPIVLGITLRKDDGSYRFIFEKPVIPSQFNENSPLQDLDNMEITLARFFHNRLEYYVRQNPEQWFWLHKRWKKAHKAKTIAI